MALAVIPPVASPTGWSAPLAVTRNELSVPFPFARENRNLPSRLTAMSTGWLPTPMTAEMPPGFSKCRAPSGATLKPESEPLPAFAVYAKRSSRESVSQHAACCSVGTDALITARSPESETLYEQKVVVHGQT